MHVTRNINIEQNINTIFNDLLRYLNAHPHINEVTLRHNQALLSKQEAERFALIGQTCMNRLAYAIDPPPMIHFDIPEVEEEYQEKYQPDEYQSEDQLEEDQLEEYTLPEMDILVTSIDFDGCADSQPLKEQIINNILHLVQRYPSIKQIIVLIGSLRQTLANDYLNAQNNAHGHGGELLSCLEIGTHFMEQLQDILSISTLDGPPPSIAFEPLMMSDLLNQFKVGTTYEALHVFHNKLRTTKNLENFIVELPDESLWDLLSNSSQPHIKNTLEWPDTSKVSTILAQMHYIARKYLSQKIHFRFYDDRVDILAPLYACFAREKLVLQNVSFDVGHNAELCHIPFQPIIGDATVIFDPREMLDFFVKKISKPERDPELHHTIVSLYHAYLEYYTSLKAPPQYSPFLIRPKARRLQNQQQERVDNQSSEALLPATCSRDPANWLNTQRHFTSIAHAGSQVKKHSQQFDLDFDIKRF